MTNLISSAPRRIGKNLQVGALGYGCWRLVAMPVAQAQACLEAALANDMNLIDTADVYGLDWGGSTFGESEALLGQVFKHSAGLRDQMVLASKGGITPGVPYDSSDIAALVEASLARLNTERIDLYQIHRPDLLTHPQELAAQLTALRAAGKIGEVGVSNHSPSQVAALQAFLDFPIATQQPEYSALQLAPLFDGTFDQCMQFGQQVVNWSPLGGGVLASGAGVSAALLAVLDELAERERVARASVALAFTLAHPVNPIALVGSINAERIAQASAALAVHLDRADVYRVIEASLGESLP